VFYLLAALTYLRFDEERDQRSARSFGLYVVASLLFVLALLSKSVTATLPAALLVIIWWQRGRLSWHRDVRQLLPWFAAAIASGLFTAWVERKLIGAEGASFDLTLVERTLLAGRVIWFYAEKLLWPAHLAFFYPHWDVPIAAQGWIGFLASTLVLTFVLWRWRHRSRGPLAAWLFFVGSLFPALGFFNVYPFVISYVADHFQYLASLGLITAVAAGVTSLLARAAPPWRTVGWGVCGGLVVGLAMLSHQESRAYTDVRTLYRTTLARNPDCWLAHNNLGADLLEHRVAGEFDEAVGHFRAALRLRPDYAAAHYNLGDALLRTPGHVAEAIAENEAALRARPNYPEAHNNLGNALAKSSGRLPEAIVHYEEALRLKPEFAEAHFNLGSALMKTPGRAGDAAAQFENVLRVNSRHVAAHTNLGILLVEQPDHASEGIAHFETALGLDPDDAEAHYNLGNALQKIPRRLNESVSHYEAALRLQPDHAEAHNNLGGALSQLPGRLNDAIAEHEAALQLKPDYAEAHYNLAVALLRTPGRRTEARAHFDAFLRLWPNPVQARQLVSRYLGP
jgi:tetratricopeptide (TPR) repeat protein